jgi:hypothetical protein
MNAVWCILISIGLSGGAIGTSHSAGAKPPARGDLMSDSLIPTEQKTSDLPPGAWGGRHIGLEVTETEARLDFDCAHGEIKGKIALDRLGRFSVAGTYVEEHGGPARQSDEKKGDPVLYAGQVTGKKMKLTIRHAKSQKPLGSFTLVNGQEPFIVKCR